MKLQLRDASSSFSAPLPWIPLQMEGENLLRDCFFSVAGLGGGQMAMLPRGHYFSSLFFRSLLNMQMLVIPKLPKKC